MFLEPYVYADFEFLDKSGKISSGMEKKRMVIKELTVKNFRNFSEHTVQFSDGINVIYGPNGSGKTSILEAVAYLSNPRSFRGARDYQVLKVGEKHFEIKGRIISGEEKHTIEIVYVQDEDKKEKVAYLDGSKVKRFRDIQEIFIAIFFSFRDYSMLMVDQLKEESFLMKYSHCLT
jgi:DNA replication and repair protein RecF